MINLGGLLVVAGVVRLVPEAGLTQGSPHGLNPDPLLGAILISQDGGDFYGLPATP